VANGTDWEQILRANAEQYARTAIANIGREFPCDLRQMMSSPGDFPNQPRDRNPVFYGSFDWHSCVEMHWLLVRLLRTAADSVPAVAVRAALDRQFTPEALAREVAYVSGPNGPGSSKSLAWARRLAAFGDRGFADMIADAAVRWYQSDADHPGGWEPSGSDFLSPTLSEAELMAQLLAPAEFGAWLNAFLPGIANGDPRALFAPAIVTDSSDGQIAHLHGLNASRAWCWRRIAESLPPGDDRIGPALAAAQAHADAALPHVVGDHYMVEHWLAAYALLLLT
jgi:hypothetical protein